MAQKIHKQNQTNWKGKEKGKEFNTIEMLTKLAGYQLIRN